MQYKCFCFQTVFMKHLTARDGENVFSGCFAFCSGLIFIKFPSPLGYVGFSCLKEVDFSVDLAFWHKTFSLYRTVRKTDTYTLSIISLI